jgi:hypothetical protein
VTWLLVARYVVLASLAAAALFLVWLHWKEQA